MGTFLLTFDQKLDITAFEGNYCFICVGFMMSRQKVPFVKLKPKGIKDATWRLLIEAWENGLSDREASFRIQKRNAEYDDADDITAEDIRVWCKNDPELGELRANLMSDLLSSAKLTVADTLKNGKGRDAIQTARWYLERKAADEFSTKQAVAFEGAVVELSLEEKEKALKEMMEKFHSNGEQ